jgi:anaphase-promoting complex subunit 2
VLLFVAHASIQRARVAQFALLRVTSFSPGPELPPVITAQQQQAEQMKVYWKVRPFIPSQLSLAPKLTIRQFIEGMLTNLGGLPLDRIQMMLKLTPGYDQSIEQVVTFMEAARKEGLVVVRDGMWRLNK